MNTTLWQNILNFDLEGPVSEYGFSTRLSHEQNWTKAFTQKAILEYKKFMYLAGTSATMVSPSEIVDQVWHQHLIFSESYSRLCSIIGKFIQHIPSTHNKDESEKFLLASQRTRNLYTQVFGELPDEIWAYNNMLSSLQMKQAKVELIPLIARTIFVSPLILLLFYYLLRPLYVNIGNPDFVMTLLLLFVVSLALLDVYNTSYLIKLTGSWNNVFVLNNLLPIELTYLKSQKREEVIHVLVNRLVEKGHINVTPYPQKLEFDNDRGTHSPEEFTILQTLKEYGTISYEKLLPMLISKPTFTTTYRTMDTLKDHLINSKVFGKLFYLNFGWLLFLLNLGIVRVITGTQREKPVDIICFVVVVMVIVSVIFLRRLTHQVAVGPILKLYQAKVATNEIEHDRWDWRYYFLGTTALSMYFIPVVENLNSRDGSGGDGGSSSGGSSCSSCGGCGGGD
ncbi:MAG: hypothetical protein EOP56_00115 [Sphingobacteriales bacterium]|nr:MAG: hypothetical protein EOP56_00115 [Sphingobacteriales bacterium]